MNQQQENKLIAFSLITVLFCIMLLLVSMTNCSTQQSKEEHVQYKCEHDYKPEFLSCVKEIIIYKVTIDGTQSQEELDNIYRHCCEEVVKE